MTKLIAATAGMALMLVLVASASAATPKLIGTVGPGYTISLKKAGKKVTTLKAGKYTFVITDKASIHNFSLDGPNGLEKTFTTRAFQGARRAITLTLKKGTYKFYCEPQKATGSDTRRVHDTGTNPRLRARAGGAQGR